MATGRPLESEFEEFVAELVRHQTGRQVTREVRVGSGLVDIVAANENASDVVLVEVRLMIPQTGSRLMDLAIRLQAYRATYRRQHPRSRVNVALAFGGVLTDQYIDFFRSQDIALWDGPRLFEWAAEHGMQEDAKRFLGGVSEAQATWRFGQIRRRRLPSLREIPSGQANWVEYQKACSTLLEYLFCPPLERPYTESSTENRINRRDIVMANYTNDGFWSFLRDQYKADFIVVEAKNLSGNAGKGHVLQIANYLSAGGLGLFGLIVTRSGLDRTGQFIQREQWLLHHKMILILNNRDVDQMLDAKAMLDTSPEALIRQKIEDFRLSV